jgi:hypothetical protein
VTPESLPHRPGGHGAARGAVDGPTHRKVARIEWPACFQCPATGVQRSAQDLCRRDRRFLKREPPIGFFGYGPDLAGHQVARAQPDEAAKGQEMEGVLDENRWDQPASASGIGRALGKPRFLHARNNKRLWMALKRLHCRMGKGESERARVYLVFTSRSPRFWSINVWKSLNRWPL